MITASLHDLGIICSLGTDKNSVLMNLTRQTDEEFLSLNTHLLVNGESLYVGQVNAELPSLGNEESHFNSRNKFCTYRCGNY